MRSNQFLTNNNPITIPLIVPYTTPSAKLPNNAVLNKIPRNIKSKE